MDWNKIILLVIAVVSFQQREAIMDILSIPESSGFSEDQEVVLYATEWCGYCKKTRRFLAREGIPYKEYDIEKSAEGLRQYNALDGAGVPLMLVNDNVVRGYSPREISYHLE